MKLENLDGKTFPHKIEDVLPLDLFFTLYDDLVDNWQLNNPTQDDLVYGKTRSLGKFKRQFNNLHYEAATIIKYKCMKYLRCDISLERIHGNGQVKYMESCFHKDYTHDDVWTVVLFTNPNWNSEWGGEFVCQDPHTKEYHHSAYIPNNAIICPSNWDHQGYPPNSKTDEMRTSLAFSYRASYLKSTEI